MPRKQISQRILQKYEDSSLFARIFFRYEDSSHFARIFLEVRRIRHSNFFCPNFTKVRTFKPFLPEFFLRYELSNLFCPNFTKVRQIHKSPLTPKSRICTYCMHFLRISRRRHCKLQDLLKVSADAQETNFSAHFNRNNYYAANRGTNFQTIMPEFYKI